MTDTEPGTPGPPEPVRPSAALSGASTAPNPQTVTRIARLSDELRSLGEPVPPLPAGFPDLTPDAARRYERRLRNRIAYRRYGGKW
jgi:hypothetical protein